MVLEENMKSLERVFGEHLSDKKQEAAFQKTVKEGPDAIDRSLPPLKILSLLLRPQI